MRSRFRTEFRSAFFELFLHELLLRLGATVELHPNVGTKGNRPDFSARFASSGRTVIVEAVSIESEDDSGTATCHRQILDEIDKRVKSPYFLLANLHFERTDKAQPPVSTVCRFVTEELERLNPEAVLANYATTSILPRIVYSDETCSIEFEAVPIKVESWHKERDKIVCAEFGAWRWDDRTSRLHASLRKKAKSYGELGMPFIVALNDGVGGVESEERSSALYGTRQEYVSGATGELCVRRVDNGLWGSTGNRQNTRVSGAATRKPVSRP
jgi:hypothetical protein